MFSQLLQIKYGVTNVATSQTFPNYIVLILTFGVALGVRGDIDKVVREHWWEYVILAVMDLEINYLSVIAYQYTTIASAQVPVPILYACLYVILYMCILFTYICIVPYSANIRQQKTSCWNFDE